MSTDHDHDPDPGRFMWHGSDLVTDQCSYCRHFRVGHGLAYCAGFPAGIPPDILGNERDHRKPHPDDDGVRFEPAPGTSPAVLARLYAILDAAG